MSTFRHALRFAAATAFACTLSSLAVALEASPAARAATSAGPEQSAAPRATLAQAVPAEDIAAPAAAVSEQPGATAPALPPLRPASSSSAVRQMQASAVRPVRAERRRPRVASRRAATAPASRPVRVRVATLQRSPSYSIVSERTRYCGAGCAGPLFLGVGF